MCCVMTDTLNDLSATKHGDQTPDDQATRPLRGLVWLTDFGFETNKQNCI